MVDLGCAAAVGPGYVMAEPNLWRGQPLLDVAGPRTTIRPKAGLTVLHVDHPRLTVPLVLKGLFDRCAAAAAY